MTEDRLGDARRRAGLRRRLLAWYRRHRRDLPWRRTGDPYRVWVSEVMLQQTRVETARGYYERFLERFPTVEALAAADEGEVLKAWEGMGYYSRARNLHRAARAVAERGGRLPDTYAGLLDLPGVGPYTAAAVSSIAFDRPHPVLDGNVTRLLCRLLRVEDDPRRAAVKARLIAAGEALMPRSCPGEFNQALMELGARVCAPTSPRCGECPWGEDCRARAELDDPAALPVRPERRPRPHLEVAAGLIRRGDRLLLAQRPPGGMLAGMWEFPGGKQEPGESLPACLRREVREEAGRRHRGRAAPGGGSTTTTRTGRSGSTPSPPAPSAAGSAPSAAPTGPGSPPAASTATPCPGPTARSSPVSGGRAAAAGTSARRAGSVADRGKRPGPLRRLYDGLLGWSETPYGGLVLFLWAFAESSVFPIPPDPFLIAMVPGRPQPGLALRPRRLGPPRSSGASPGTASATGCGGRGRGSCRRWPGSSSTRSPASRWSASSASRPSTRAGGSG